MDTLNTSDTMTGAPGYGAHVDMLASLKQHARNKSENSARLAAIYENIYPDRVSDDTDDLSILAENDLDEEDDTEQAVSITTPPPEALPKKNSTPMPDKPSVSEPKAEETQVEEVKTEDTEAEQEDTDQKNIIPFILAGVAVVVIIVIICISKAGSGKKKEEASVNTSVVTSDTPVTNVTTFYADTLSQEDTERYQDTMVIDKCIELNSDSCQYIFSGYAENARAFIKFKVSLNTYNKYKTGARVAITYERITLNNKNYYMDVEVL